MLIDAYHYQAASPTTRHFSMYCRESSTSFIYMSDSTGGFKGIEQQ